MKKFTLGIVLSIVFLLTGVVNAQISTFPYAESFEAGPGGWVASGTNSSWALGTPANTVIVGASDGTNAWITNLAGSYNVNEDSNVMSPVFDFSAVAGDPTIKMDIWWNSEFSWDGTNLQSSTDAGATWTNVGALADPNNWYNDGTINGNPGGSGVGWTGTFANGSGGYVEAEHLLDGMAGQASVQLRVAFGSDGSVTDNGFAFDNVRITTQIGDAPVIACPADLMVDTTAGMCSGVANWATPVALDTEDGPITAVQTMGPASGSTLPTGVTTIEYTATDSDGNAVSCQFTVTVTDNEAPVTVCQDVTVELDAAGMYTLSPAEIDGGSSDNCGIVTQGFGITAPPSTGSLATTYATNNGGNVGWNQYFDLTVGPVDITVESIDVHTSSSAAVTMDVYTILGSYLGNETNAAAWGAPTATGSGTGAGTGLPTPMALNASFTLLANTTYGFAINMDASPLYTNGTGCPGNQCYSNAEISLALGTAQPGLFTGALFTPRIFNGSINYSVAAGIVPFNGEFDCSMVGANAITLYNTDANGNVTSCEATVTVQDNIAPVLTCIGEQVVGPFSTGDAPNVAIVDNSTVTTTIDVTDDFVITDLNVDMNISHTWTGDLVITLESPAGTQVVIFDGNADGCSGDNIMDIYDDESANALDCQAGTADAFPLADYMPSNPLSGFDGEGTLGTWTLHVEDGAGGDSGTIDSWALIYDFAPIVSPTLEVVLDANGNASINAADLLLSIDEACGYDVTVGGAPVPITLSAPLVNGNGNFGNMFDVNALNDITVNSFDVHGDPGLTFDVNVWVKTGTYVGFEADASAWTLLDTAVAIVSNGDGVVTPLNLTLGYTIPAGETHAFFVSPIGGGFNYHNGTAVGAIAASDANVELLEGAAVDEAFSGTVFAPRVFEGNIIYSAGAGVSNTLDLDCSNLGENIIEVTVTDASGNVSTCMATVTVLDETAPILICSDTTIELGPDGTATVDPMALLAVMPTTYNVMTISSDNQSGSEGFTDLTVPVTEAATITFNWDYSTPDGALFDSFGYLVNGTFTEVSDPAGATNQSGTATVTVAPGDVFGFRSQSDDGSFGACTTVVSNFMPGFIGQFDPANWTQTLTNSDGSAVFVEIPGGPLSFDACGITVLAVDVTEVNCDDIGSPVTITVFASDASGNIASCTSIVTVIDALGPVVTCPADQTQDPGTGNLFYEVPDYFATGEATAEDNCTDPVTIMSQDPAAGTLLPDGVYPVTISAEDEYGNVGSCTFTLTVTSTAGVEDNALDIAITMYPNPAKEQVTISNNSNIQLEKATIYDLNGKMVNQVNLSNMQGEKVIDVSALASGVYVVQIISDQSSAVKRLIKD